jgi:hypothetical protein
VLPLPLALILCSHLLPANVEIENWRKLTNAQKPKEPPKGLAHSGNLHLWLPPWQDVRAGRCGSGLDHAEPIISALLIRICIICITQQQFSKVYYIIYLKKSKSENHI